MKKPLLVLVVVLVAVAGWWKLRDRGGRDDAEASDSKLVLDRIWIDHMPRNDRDIVNFFAAITEEPFGIFQAASQWKANYELFRYEAHGDEIRILYPQNGDRERVKARARTCNEGGMDYCMEMDGSTRGVKRYYSRKGWEIDSHATAEQVRERIDALSHATAE
jgi:hypothetical protein